jgi:hypothetical protein
MSSSTSSSSSTPMEGISIRDKLLELHERRKAIENDVEVLTIELESTGAGVKVSDSQCMLLFFEIYFILII